MEDGMGKPARMEYTISAATLTVIFTDTSPFTPRRTVFEIFSWEKVANNDKNTNGDYPSGFLLGLRSAQGNETATIFIHRDKKSLIEIKAPADIYVKQSADGDAPEAAQSKDAGAKIADGYDKVTWGMSSKDVIKAYKLNKKDLEYLDTDDYDVTYIIHINPSEQIKSRGFFFYRDKLMQVFVYYTDVVALESLQDTLSEKYGTASKPQVSRDGRTHYSFNKYQPKLSVDLYIDNKELSIVYCGREYYNKWIEDKNKKPKVEL